MRGADLFSATTASMVARPFDGGASIDIPNPTPAVFVEAARVNDRPGVYWRARGAVSSINHWDTHTSVVVTQNANEGAFGVSHDTLFYLDPNGQLVAGDLDGTGLRTSDRRYTSIFHVSNTGTVFAAWGATYAFTLSPRRRAARA